MTMEAGPCQALTYAPDTVQSSNQDEEQQHNNMTLANVVEVKGSLALDDKELVDIALGDATPEKYTAEVLPDESSTSWDESGLGRGNSQPLLPFGDPSRFFVSAASERGLMQAHERALILARQLEEEEERDSGAEPVDSTSHGVIISSWLSKLQQTIHETIGAIGQPYSRIDREGLEDDVELVPLEKGTQISVSVDSMPTKSALKSPQQKPLSKKGLRLKFDEMCLERDTIKGSTGPSIKRLTPEQKSELYDLRPDLHIVPNWTQKYREEMRHQHERDSSSTSVVVLLLLFVLVLMIVSVLALLTTSSS